MCCESKEEETIYLGYIKKAFPEKKNSFELGFDKVISILEKKEKRKKVSFRMRKTAWQRHENMNKHGKLGKMVITQGDKNRVCMKMLMGAG